MWKWLKTERLEIGDSHSVDHWLTIHVSFYFLQFLRIIAEVPNPMPSPCKGGKYYERSGTILYRERRRKQSITVDRQSTSKAIKCKLIDGKSKQSQHKLMVRSYYADARQKFHMLHISCWFILIIVECEKPVSILRYTQFLYAQKLHIQL